MTTRSTTKKTLQNFHARNTLWDAFNRHAEDMDCSVDYLINEAMRLYATEQGFIEATGTGSAPTPTPTSSPRAPVPTMREKPSAKLPVPGGGGRPTPGAPKATGGPSLPKRPAAGAPQVPRRPSAPPPPPPRPSAEPAPAERPTLTIIFQGRKLPINQDQFIIGRGSKASDLAIKDANISRKHAAVIFHNGAYYMKDLGSTNGVEFGGQPIDSKRIDEGDVFSICGYDIHFTYTA